MLLTLTIKLKTFDGKKVCKSRCMQFGLEDLGVMN